MKIRSQAALLTLGALTLSACGGGTEGTAEEGEDLVIDGQTIATAELLEEAREEGTFTFYTASGEAGEQFLLDEFEELTGITGEVIRIVPSRLNERALSEHGSGQLAADVIRTSGWDMIDELSEAGVFQQLNLPEDFDFPEEAVHEEGLYYTSYNRPYLIGYNEMEHEGEPPTSWDDLLTLEPSGAVEITASGTSQELVRFQREVMGDDWLTEQADTDVRVFDSASPLTDAMARGEIVSGPVPSTVGLSAAEEGAPIAMVAPDEGFPVNQVVIGLTEQAENSAAAEVFINWTLSTEGQSFATEVGDYPVNSEVGLPGLGDTELPPLDDERVWTISKDDYLEHYQDDADFWHGLFN